MQASKLQAAVAPHVRPLTQTGVPAGCQANVRPQEDAESQQHGRVQRRAVLLGAGAIWGLAAGSPTSAAPVPPAATFIQTSSGLLIQDITTGQGRIPQPGDRVVVHWAGRTKNYQAKRIDNTSLRDEPFEFILGAGQVIPAFEEAVSSMRVGGVRRIEVLGEIPSLSYPRDRNERFVTSGKYRYLPQPKDFDGQRALDFVLDNQTLSDTNRTLLFDIKLLGAYPRQ